MSFLPRIWSALAWIFSQRHLSQPVKKNDDKPKKKWRRATTTSDPKGHASVQCGSKSQDCLRPWEVRVKMTGSHWRSGTWNWRMDNKLQWAFQQWKPSCSCIPWTLLSPSLTMAVIIIRMLPNLRCKRVVNRLHDGDKFKSTLNHELSLTLTESRHSHSVKRPCPPTEE